MNKSDKEDLRLFAPFGDPKLSRNIIQIKQNDPRVDKLDVYCHRDHEDERVWIRLGCILEKNKTVRTLNTLLNDDAVALLFAAIQNNRSIEIIQFNGISLQATATLHALVPHLSRNPSLKKISLMFCNLGSDGIEIISRALSDRSEDTLEILFLHFNDIPDVDLDQLVLTLSRKKSLTWLSLSHNRIGLRGCTSLAKLLENRQSNLNNLDLDGNSINDKSVVILANSLAKNTKLQSLDLSNNKEITKAGLSAILKVVCNHSNSSIDNIMNSNHTLCEIGIPLADLNCTLGVDDANLLCVSLEANLMGDNMWAVRRKTIWSHALGRLNLGASSVPTGAMPHIMEWTGGSDMEWIWDLDFHDPPLPMSRLNAIKLDGLYRIIRSMPDLCSASGKESIPDGLEPGLKEIWPGIYNTTMKQSTPNDLEETQKQTRVIRRENKELCGKMKLLEGMIEDGQSRKRQRINGRGA